MTNSDLRAANDPTPTGVPGEPESRSEGATGDGETASQRRLSGRMCECAACGRIFSGLTMFDQHRFWATPQMRSCHGTVWMRVKGWRLVGGVWRGPAMTEQQKAERGWA